MQIFELTQRKKTNEISYDSLERAAAEKKSRSPNFATGTGPGVQPQMTVTPTMRAASSAPASSTAANFATGTGPGVQPQYTATPKMKAAPQPAPAPQLPAPAANQLATTAPAPEIQTIAAPAQLPAPAAAKQIGTNYDPNVVDVDAREVPSTPAVPTIDNPVNPNVKPGGSKEAQAFRAQQAAQQQSQAAQGSQNTAAIPPEPVPAAQPSTTQTSKVAKANTVAPAPSTPGVRGSRTGAVVSALGSRLRDKLAADAGLSGAPDTGDNNAYGDQRAAAARAAAPLINQQAREEMAKWNQAVANTVKQAGVSSPAQLPTATKQALSRSLMNQVYTNFLQGQLGKKYKDLPQYVDGKVQQEAAAQVAKLDNSIKAILNFNAPVSSPEAQMQRWQDLSQATYDMRSLLQFYPKKLDYTKGQKMPTLRPTPNGLQIGSFALGQSDQTSTEILKMIRDLRNKVTGELPTVSMTPTGQWQIGNYPLDPSNPRDLQLTKILKTEKDRLNKTTTAESLTWSRGFDPSKTLLKKVRQL